MNGEYLEDTPGPWHDHIEDFAATLRKRDRPRPEPAPAGWPSGAAPAVWDELSDDEAAERWHVFSEWVQWLIWRYSVDRSIIPDCWWAHGAHTEELTALWQAWCISAEEGRNAPNDWHSRLDGALYRLQGRWKIDCGPNAHHAPHRRQWQQAGHRPIPVPPELSHPHDMEYRKCDL